MATRMAMCPPSLARQHSPLAPPAAQGLVRVRAEFLSQSAVIGWMRPDDSLQSPFLRAHATMSDADRSLPDEAARPRWQVGPSRCQRHTKDWCPGLAERQA